MGLGNIQEPPQGIKSKLPRRITATTTLLPDDFILECDSPTNINVFLPDITELFSQKIYYIKNYGIGEAIVVPMTLISQTIDRSTDYTVNQNGAIAISPDIESANWLVVADRL